MTYKSKKKSVTQTIWGDQDNSAICHSAGLCQASPRVGVTTLEQACANPDHALKAPFSTFCCKF